MRVLKIFRFYILYLIVFAHSCQVSASYPVNITIQVLDLADSSGVITQVKLFNTQGQFFSGETNEQGVISTIFYTAVKDKPAVEKPDKYYLSANYPNPFMGLTKVNLHTATPAVLKVFNIVGQEVFSKHCSPDVREVTLDLSNYARGIYLLALFSEDGRIVQRRKLLHLESVYGLALSHRTAPMNKTIVPSSFTNSDSLGPHDVAITVSGFPAHYGRTDTLLNVKQDTTVVLYCVPAPSEFPCIQFQEDDTSRVFGVSEFLNASLKSVMLNATSMDTSKLAVQMISDTSFKITGINRYNSDEFDPAYIQLEIVNNQDDVLGDTIITPIVYMMTDLEGNVYVADHATNTLVPVPGAQVIAPGGVEAVADASGYYHLKITPQAPGLVTVKHPGGEAEAYDRQEFVLLGKDIVIPFGLVKGDVDIEYMEKCAHQRSLRPIAVVDESNPLVTVQGDSIMVPFYFDDQGKLSERFGEIGEEVLAQFIHTMHPGRFGYLVDDSTKAVGKIYPTDAGYGGGVNRDYDESRTKILRIGAYFNYNTVDTIDEIRRNVLLLEFGKGFSAGVDSHGLPHQNRLFETPRTEIITEYHPDDIAIGITSSLVNRLYGEDGYWANKSNASRPRGTHSK